MTFAKLSGLLLAIMLTFSACALKPPTTEPGVLTPSQVDASMVDKVVKVRGKVLWVTESPGGLGGVYAPLSDGKAEVGVRVQPQVWDTLSGEQKAQFKEGRTLTAEGILFKAGKNFVVIHGKYEPTPQQEPVP